MKIYKKRIKKLVFGALLTAVGLMAINIHARADSYQIGDIITLGTYEQNNNRRDGKEEIEWIIIDQKNDQFLVISKNCIDCKPYNSTLMPVTWESCTLRKWLNEDFLDEAFTEEEQRQNILTVINENPSHPLAGTGSGRETNDKIFILSMQEASDLFTTYSSRQAPPSAYAAAQGAYQNKNNQMGWWWLRTTSYNTDHVTYVTSGGDVSTNGRKVTREDAGVRPAMWISF